MGNATLKLSLALLVVLFAIPATQASHLDTACPFTLHSCLEECSAQNAGDSFDCSLKCMDAVDAALNQRFECLQRLLHTEALGAYYGNTVAGKCALWMPAPPPLTCPFDVLPAECDKQNAGWISQVRQSLVDGDAYQRCKATSLQKAAEQVETGRVPATPPAVPAQGISSPVPALPKKPIPEHRIIISKALEVQGTVEVKSPDGSWMRVASNRPLKLGDRIRIGQGHLRITLFDDTEITLGPNSDVRFDETVFDIIEPGGYVEVIKGIFRYVTGKVAQRQPAKMRFRLPVGNLGFRGTDFIAAYDDTTKTATVSVNEGVVSYTPFATNETLEIPAGKAAVIQESGEATTAALSTIQWDDLVKQVTLAAQRPSLKENLLAIVIIAVIVWAFVSVLRWMRRSRGNDRKLQV
ncbi:FecR domain-containing protein [Candidatus Woesearchaeota archaeon]|nr:FecR domain-containing protein [Candidatus Woesearchaeota archaeon]